MTSKSTCVFSLLLLFPGFALPQSPDAAAQKFQPALIQSGQSLFQQDCAFCHGRDAGGGETGPDLTRSKLVGDDVQGDKIGSVVRNGRPDAGMPRFSLTDQQIAGLTAFIHNQKTIAETQKGGRKGVDDADLKTGNAEAGKAYFNGAGHCSTCHSPTGDLAGIASRYDSNLATTDGPTGRGRRRPRGLLGLEEQMLYPRDAKATLTVTLPSGQTLTGTLAYQDEFTVALRDDNGRYHSWPTRGVKFTVDEPAEAHAAQLSKYTDEDVHNLMAYLETLQ